MQEFQLKIEQENTIVTQEKGTSYKTLTDFVFLA